MKNRLKPNQHFFSFISCLCSSLFILNSCALTLPASESLVFEEQYKESDIIPRGRGAASDAFPVEEAIIVTFRPKVNAELEYAKDKFSSFIQKKLENNININEEDLRIRNSYQLSIALPILLIDKEDVQLAASYGLFVLGVDATFRLYEETFLTANMGWLEGEIIVQHKIINTQKLGLAVGGYYRIERRGFEIRDGGFGAIFAPFLGPDKIFYNKIAGLRLNGYWSVGDNSFLHFVVAPGHAFNLQASVLNLGLGITLNF